MQALMTTTAPIVGIAMMDEQEARSYITMMRDDIDTADQSLKNFRARAFDFAEREGWRALGYAGVIPAIQGELGQQYSKSYLSRILKAGSIEQALELPIGQLSERTLRPLGELDTAEQQRAAWQRMNELTAGKPTATAAAQAVAEIKPAEPDFEDAHQRAAAIGYTLIKHGTWWRLSGKSDEHPAAPPATVLQALEILETVETKRVKKPAGWVCDVCGQTITDMRKPVFLICTACAMAPPAIPADLLALIQERGYIYHGLITILGERLYTIAHKDYPDNMRSLSAKQLREWEQPHKLTIAELDETLPKELENAGYYWKSAEPPTVANNDGWSADAPTAQAALLMATTRLQKRKEEAAEPATIFPALSRAELTTFIREAKDFIEQRGGQRWPTIGAAIRIAARMALEVSE